MRAAAAKGANIILLQEMFATHFSAFMDWKPANFCAKDLGELRHHASCRLRSMQRRRTLVAAFWRQAELFRVVTQSQNSRQEVAARGSRIARSGSDDGDEVA